MTETRQIKDALLQAKSLVKETDRPVLVNVLIGKSNFRDGSISV